MATYSKELLKKVAGQYGISPEELSGAAPKVSQDIARNLAQKLYNAPVSKSDQGFNYKTFDIEGKTYHWGGGSLYSQDWQKLGAVAEGRHPDVMSQMSSVLGYAPDVVRAQKIKSAQEFLPGYAKTQQEIALQDTTPASGKSYVNAAGKTVTPQTAQEEKNMIGLGFKQPGAEPGPSLGTKGAAPTAPTLGTPVEGFPQATATQTAQEVMAEWQQKYTFDPNTKRWYEKVAGGGVAGGGGEIPSGEGEGPDVPSLAFDLSDMITGEFTSDDLINIFSTPITQGDIDKLLDENVKLRQSFLDSLTPTQVELDLKSDLVDLRNEIQTKQLNYKKGVADIKQSLVSTRVMAGEEEALYTQTELGMQTLLLKEQNLLMHLGLEQEARESSQKVLGAVLEFNESDISRMMTMQNQIQQQKMNLFNIMSQFSTRAQNTLNIVLDGLAGVRPGDLNSNDMTKLQSMTKNAGIPWVVIQNAMEVKANEYDYGQYVQDLDILLKEQKLGDDAKGEKYSSGSMTIYESDISDAQSQLDATRGKDDKYVYTPLYTQLLDAWKKDGGLEQDFFTEFPPKNYLNPNDASVPKYIREKLSKPTSDYSEEDLSKIIEDLNKPWWKLW